MAVFFSTYEPEDYSLYGRGLVENDVPMDPNRPERIGLRPDWSARSDRGKYFMFNLHSLRFVYSLIEPGARGDNEALGHAKNLFLFWNECNPAGSIGWDDEHSVSWRSVTLAYLWEVWCASTRADDPVTKTWLRMATAHGRYLSRPSNYRPHHNHGLNNALGLVALGSAFHDVLPRAGDWIDLGFQRGEQQMRDNVSDGGIHLEQSGFYHCYTLRTFLELHRAATALGREVPTTYSVTLDRMLGMAARIAGRTAVSQCVPYSDPRKDPLREFPLLGEASLPPGLEGPGVERFREALRELPSTDFVVDEPGGFAITGASDPTELSLVFHTRILSGPHAHHDALGLYACLGDRELLLLPSTMFTSEQSRDWHRYFIGPAAHNTVQVDSLQQRPIRALRPGRIAEITDAYKARRLVAGLGLADAYDRFRKLAKLDHRTLRERSTSLGGEILASGATERCEYVTARHRCYSGVTHTRTVARIGGRWLIVRDRIRGSSEHRYRQTWHFPPGADVAHDASRGVVTLDQGPDSGFAQLVSGVGVELCSGKPAPDPGGWYATSPADPIPIPAIRYETRGTEAEFVWVLQAGHAKFDLQSGRGGPGDALREIQLDGPAGRFTVLLDDIAVRAETSTSG